MLTSEKVSFDNTYCVVCSSTIKKKLCILVYNATLRDKQPAQLAVFVACQWQYSLNHGKNSADGVTNCPPQTISRF